MDTSSVVSCLRDVRPPVISYAPSIWAHTFSNFSFDDQEQQKHAEAIEAMKQDVQGMLMAAATPLKKMILIDTLERLGLAYHFETQIEHKLQQISDNYIAGDDDDDDDDLFTTALRFRLLRQHQHHISCDVFEKFVNKAGEFEETLSSDAEGLLSLYEAAHVRFRDEKILDDAVIFTTHHLNGMESASLLKSPMKEKVQRALEHPLHRIAPIIYARSFIPIYERDDSRDELLLKLAKINFNYLQNLYRDELSQLSGWWNKFDLKSKLPYARDRLAEAYIWGVGYHYEPQYSYVRMGLAKGIQIIAIIDDTYDNYVTVNEAQLFTQIWDRWSVEESDPDFMKIVCHFVMSTCEDYDRDAENRGKAFAAPYFKETVQQLARAYNQELKWVMERQLPSFEDYIKNSEITSCVYLMFAAIIPGLKSATQETVDWMKSSPRIAISTAMIGRYWDDIGSHERENKGGKILTVVDCYMKQYGVSKQETISKFAEEVENAWKDLNEEWIVTTTSVLPKETAIHLLNYARMCEVTYNRNNGDSYTDPHLYKPHIAALFLHPILI